MTIDVPGVARVLGGKRVLGEEIRTLGALRHAVNKGLPVEALHHTTGYVTSSPREAVQLRDRLVPPATRKRRKGRLKPANRNTRLHGLGPADVAWNTVVGLPAVMEANNRL